MPPSPSSPPPSLLKFFFVSLVPLTFVSLALGVGLIYQSNQIFSLQTEVNLLRQEVSSTTKFTTLALSNTSTLSKGFADLRTETAGIAGGLTSAKQNIDDVKNQVGNVQNQVGGVAQTVSSLSGNLDTLEKLAKSDPELLKKYSKVYFLSENYVPKHLIEVPTEYTYNGARQERYLGEAWPHLKTMLDTSKAYGITLYVKSAYRSFAEQKSLKGAYGTIYGAGTANAFSAEQGYSEHQLGTAVDFISIGQNGNLTGFEKTAASAWLSSNAYKYGFILSYPKGNNFYVYEPWHFRFIGVGLATYLHDNNFYFYNVEQRNIDTYLVDMFK